MCHRRCEVSFIKGTKIRIIFAILQPKTGILTESMQRIRSFILPIAIVLGLLLHEYCAKFSVAVPYLIFCILLLTFSAVDVRIHNGWYSATGFAYIDPAMELVSQE